MSLEVSQPGVLALLQDNGRIGHHRIGLTTGGPLDRLAFDYCNRLLDNPPGATCIEVSFGGLELEAAVDTFICLTGADMPLTINGVARTAWEVHPLRAGRTPHGRSGGGPGAPRRVQRVDEAAPARGARPGAVRTDLRRGLEQPEDRVVGAELLVMRTDAPRCTRPSAGAIARPRFPWSGTPSSTSAR